MTQKVPPNQSPAPKSNANAGFGGSRGSALSGKEIWQASKRPLEPFVVMPSFHTQEELRRANCVDLRLGNDLILMRKGEIATLKFDDDNLTETLHRFYEPKYVSFAQDFILHPGELVLGATLEYIVLPKDLMAYIIGRSSWGRLGLIIATATVIQPGYKGCPTLELVNTGNIPLQIFPGSPIPIAQLSLHWVGPGQKGYAGKYSEHRWVGPTGPGYSKIHKDKLFSEWMKYRKRLRQRTS
jgi:dCTP deaminase